MHCRFILHVLLILSITSFQPCLSQDPSLAESLQTLNEVGNVGQGHRPTISAWRQVGAANPDSLPQILKSLDETKPLSANWIRAAVDQIAERAVRDSRELPRRELEEIVFDPSYAPRARRLAYEWLTVVDPTAKQRIIPQMLNDSSLEMRRDAVALALRNAESATADPEAKKRYLVALSAARDPDQIDQAFERLKELGEEVDLPKHFGFITKWKLIGPFDNTDKQGFEVAYPPEKVIDLNESYQGKRQEVSWFDHQTEDKYGMVDLNAAVGKNMGAAAYALATFDSSVDREVELRLGSICATKVWLNGELKMSNEVYHSGTKIDQYVSLGKLKAGKNSILVKICQNEQTENWAQDWQFQFRVCDRVGTAILSEDRK